MNDKLNPEFTLDDLDGLDEKEYKDPIDYYEEMQLRKFDREREKRR